jgi:hypothetical protein
MHTAMHKKRKPSSFRTLPRTAFPRIRGRREVKKLAKNQKISKKGLTNRPRCDKMHVISHKYAK